MTPYLPHVSQPCIVREIGWQMPAPLRTASPKTLLQIDDWIKHGLDLNITSYAKAKPGAADDIPRTVAEPLWRLMSIACELLRLINVPVFDPGHIIRAKEMDKKSGDWRVTLATPRVDDYPERVFPQAYDFAARLLAVFSRTERNSRTLKQVQRLVQEKFIDIFSPMVPSGLSTLPILTEAYRRQIPFRHIGSHTFQLGWGAKARLMRNGAIDADSAIGSVLVHNKLSCARLLRTAGLPAPEHSAAKSADAALAVAQTLGWPVVVKPADRERGEGVTKDILDPEALKTAYAHAAKMSKQLIVEKQVPGDCHRIHIAGGTVVQVNRRLPKSVRGDDQHPVRELIALANAEQEALPPWKRLKPFPDDELASHCLAEAGLSLDAVPAAGQWAPLRPFASVAWGGVVEDLTQAIHPANAQVAIQAARIFRLTSVGVDMICEDISVPWYESGAIINEVNYSPQTGQMTGTGPAHTLQGTMDAYFPDSARIPVEVVAATGDVAPATLRQQALTEAGNRCLLVSATHCLDPAGAEIPLYVSGLFNRVVALLALPDTEALVVVVEDDKLLATGMPFDSIDALHLGKGAEALSPKLLGWLKTIAKT